jgi:predicted metalloenzyme YecM
LLCHSAFPHFSALLQMNAKRSVVHMQLNNQEILIFRRNDLWTLALDPQQPTYGTMLLILNRPGNHDVFAELQPGEKIVLDNLIKNLVYPQLTRILGAHALTYQTAPEITGQTVLRVTPLYADTKPVPKYDRSHAELIPIFGTHNDGFDGFLQSLQKFWEKSLTHLALTAGIEIKKMTLDHACWRTESIPEYEALMEYVAAFSTHIDTSEINGRPISVIKLNEPVCVRGNKLFLVEICAPGRTAYPSGWEHLAFVTDQLLVMVYNPKKIAYGKQHLHDPRNPHISVQLPSVGSVDFHSKGILEVLS